MSDWRNGGLLRVTGLNDVNIRILVQDNKVSIRSEGAVLSPEGMRKMGQALLDGADALTQDEESATV